MTYRELLEYCKSHPGCLGTKEQKEADRTVRTLLRSQQNRKNETKKD